MDVFEAITKRYSCRSYRSIPIEHQKLAEAANNQEFIASAGAIIVACSNSDYIMACGQPIGPIDVSIALEHISLEATELGLATCWIGSFDPARVKMILGIPDNVTVIELMPVGYPADNQPKARRKPVENIASYEKWAF